MTSNIQGLMDMVAVDGCSSNDSTPKFNKERVTNTKPKNGNGDGN